MPVAFSSASGKSAQPVAGANVSCEAASLPSRTDPSARSVWPGADWGASVKRAVPASLTVQSAAGLGWAAGFAVPASAARNE